MMLFPQAAWLTIPRLASALALEGNINIHGNKATRGCRKGFRIRSEFQP